MHSFIAYASNPSDIGSTIEEAVKKINNNTSKVAFSTWASNDIAGRPLVDPIFEKVENSDFIVADVSVLNFNVIFEIGYAIGQNKRAVLIRNKNIVIDEQAIQKIGIFDTLGHQLYSDSDDLSSYLSSVGDITPLPIRKVIDPKAKTWVLQTPLRSESMTRIIAQIKKKLFAFRSFDPAEQPRMPARETIDQIGASTGVVIPLLAEHIVDSKIHNMRAAFAAGLATGMGKVVLLLKDESYRNAPLDVRDFLKTYKHPQDIDRLIAEFRDEIEKAYYGYVDLPQESGTLEALQIGTPTAENEFQTLQAYYLRTDEYGKAIRGETNLVLGRKGSGKTALFSQIRNELRRDKANVIIDLKPEGYQLIKLKDVVLKYLEKGSEAHLVTAFWDYILLLEIAYKLLEKDEGIFNRDPKLHQAYIELAGLYNANGYVAEGDFSERLIQFANHISQSYSATFGNVPNTRLSGDQITQLLFKHDIRKLRKSISNYLSLKKQVWVLFDNIDKGWATHGVEQEDVLIVHSLIEAAWKIDRDMQREKHDFHSIIFLRNDVYQLLVRNMPDRGKDIRVSLDWHDRGKLKELVRKRLAYNGKPAGAVFEKLWNEVCIPEINGESAIDYLIDRSLMRPRYLLLLISHCRGAAINNNHNIIQFDDIQKGVTAYSNDLIVETSVELRDVFPSAENLIYQFIGEEADLFDTDLSRLYRNASIPEEQHTRTTDFLLWYGVLGVVRLNNLASYIHDVGYDMQKLTTIRQKEGGDCPIYRINAAYWSGLGISLSDKQQTETNAKAV